MIFDGILIIGVIFYINFYINIGYGILGWIMVCGFVSILVDVFIYGESLFSCLGLDLFCYLKVF